MEKDNSGDNSATERTEADAADAMGTLIDPAFQPHSNHIAVCKMDGATDEEIATQVRIFIAHKQESGSFSNDWDASWLKWWERWKAHRAELHRSREAAKPKAPPRVEVSSKQIDWNAHATRWASGAGWPRGVGADPSSPACRCPADVLLAHGIDPTTGLKLTTEKA